LNKQSLDYLTNPPTQSRQDLKTKATNYNKANKHDIALGCLTRVVGGWGLTTIFINIKIYNILT